MLLTSVTIYWIRCILPPAENYGDGVDLKSSPSVFPVSQFLSLPTFTVTNVLIFAHKTSHLLSWPFCFVLVLDEGCVNYTLVKFLVCLFLPLSVDKHLLFVVSLCLLLWCKSCAMACACQARILYGVIFPVSFYLCASKMLLCILKLHCMGCWETAKSVHSLPPTHSVPLLCFSSLLPSHFSPSLLFSFPPSRSLSLSTCPPKDQS